MLRDLETGGPQALATGNGNFVHGEVIGTRFAISPDGTCGAFVSSSDVFVRDQAGGSTWLVPCASSGAASTTSQHWIPSFVSNHQVAFATGSGTSLGAQGPCLKHLNQGTLTLLLGTAEGGASHAVLSGDARQVAFQRLYSGSEDRVFVRGLSTGQQALVSASASGTPNSDTATRRELSRDGSTVTFGSNARDPVSPRPPAGVLQLHARTIGSAGAQ